ncbi:hypothetical protein NIES2119_19885 [[Phormidium ambiguum] IAM M-71]|uniref:P pilus assembly/Cpx signaling pathway, periplasmic inhibitor/zinc-resistance associated protein n=1 Tax=[Phormidium ambiguum] IAM M-71 TaxID=454136 RepID=A0A1U7IF25_9CYAN|nr:hypothetical protein [Phormidium ambiguum]OKH35522.1 hypothetical protein NIES2119_19885 [Phormidium ambiguum IAM M-71]
MAFSSAKLVSLFASIVALATMGSQVALAQQSPRPTTPSQTNSQPQSIEEFLGLSQQQVKQIRDILVDRQEKIVAVLTEQQRKLLMAAMENQRQNQNQNQNPSSVIQQLNLSKEQQDRIGTIVKASNDQIRAVLTPEQLQKLQSQLQQQRPNQNPNQNSNQNQNRR